MLVPALTALVLLIPTEPPAGQARIVAVGDIFFGRYYPSHAGHRYKPVTRAAAPFAALADLLGNTDLTFGNLETPVMPEPASFRVSTVLTFRADPSAAATLRDGGFDVLSLANNHMANLGPGGAAITRRTLEHAGLTAVGGGATSDEAMAPVLLEVNGLRIGVLAFTVWNNLMPQADGEGATAYIQYREFVPTATAAIQAARQKLAPDFLVVSLHWGLEYKEQPTPFQVRQAHALVDAGADLVLGHHPHVVQPVERYGNGVIAYSLGNFLFDQNPLATRRSIALRATLSGHGEARRITDVDIVPLMLGKDHLPRPALGPPGCAWRRVLASRNAVDIAPAPRSLRCGAQPKLVLRDPP